MEPTCPYPRLGVAWTLPRSLIFFSGKLMPCAVCQLGMPKPNTKHTLWQRLVAGMRTNGIKYYHSFHEYYHSFHVFKLKRM